MRWWRDPPSRSAQARRPSDRPPPRHRPAASVRHTASSNSRSTSLRLSRRSCDASRQPITRAHASWYVPAGNVRGLVPGTTTARGGTSPRYSTGSGPVTSMIGTDAVRDDVGREDGALADPDALGDDAARAEERAVLDDHGCRLRRLQDAADADASCQVDVGPDLRARADRRPGVDHRPRPDPRADVDVAGHQHDALREERAAARDARRHHAHPGRRVDVLDGDLVEVAEASDLHRLDLAEPEVEEDRLLRPLVHDPAVGPGLGDTKLAPVEQVDRLLDRPGVELAALPHGLDRLAERHQRTSSRIAAARAHSSSVGTSA